MSEESDFLDKVRRDFLQEAMDLLDYCEEALLGYDGGANHEKLLAEIFRCIHTIKGSGAAVGLVRLAEFAHDFEDCLAALRTHPDQLTFDMTSLLLSCLDTIRGQIQRLTEGQPETKPDADLIRQLQEARALILGSAALQSQSTSAAFGVFDDEPAAPGASSPVPSSPDEHPGIKRENTSIKVDSKRIESVVDLVGELVVLKSQLINKTEPYVFDVALAAVVSMLDKTVRELQDKALAIRMMPIKPLFMKMQRMARDLSIKVGKSIEFEMEGEDTELDRMVVELLSDPLLHLIRNAIDHGLEPAADRQKAGKRPAGRIRLTAAQSSGRILVCVSDDGRGIRRDLVLEKARERGLIKADAPTQSLRDQDVFALLLAPGFSTAEKVTDISGRGVGLDVVHSQIEKLKGSLQIRSEPGHGSSFELSMPLTAAVTEGMLVEIGGQTLAIPMDRIRELVKIEPNSVVTVSAGQDVLNIRGQMLPILSPPALFPLHGSSLPAPNLAVILEHQQRNYALGIGSVIGQMQVIMKPMNAALPSEVVAGVTILGDGQVALIADVDGLVQAYLQSHTHDAGGRMAA